MEQLEILAIQGSEWNELMYRVSSANPNGTGENFCYIHRYTVEQF